MSICPCALYIAVVVLGKYRFTDRVVGLREKRHCIVLWYDVSHIITFCRTACFPEMLMAVRSNIHFATFIFIFAHVDEI